MKTGSVALLVFLDLLVASIPSPIPRPNPSSNPMPNAAAIPCLPLVSPAWAEPAPPGRAETLAAALPPAPGPGIDAFIQIASAGAPVLSPDGDRLFFTSMASGTAQIYRLLPNGWPYQLTVFSEGIDFSEFNRDCTFAVLGVDTGGNELHQLYLLDASSGEVRPLTDEPRVRHASVLWSRDGMRIFYAANAVDPASFYIYEMDLRTGKSRCLLEKKGSNYVGDESPDGTWLLVGSTTSSLDSNYSLYDPTTREQRPITPHTGEHSYWGGAFSADGREVFYVTDDTPDGMSRLFRLDLASMKKAPLIREDSNWELEAVQISDSRRYLAYVMNEDGYGRLHLFDLAESRPIPVPTMDGLVTNPIPTDAGYLAFTFNSPTRTADIWVWKFADIGKDTAARAGAVIPRTEQLEVRRRGRVRSASGGSAAGWGRSSHLSREWSAGKAAGSGQAPGQALDPGQAPDENHVPRPGALNLPDVQAEAVPDWRFSSANPVQVTFSSYAGVDPSLFHEPELVRYRSFDGVEIPAFLYLPPGRRTGPIPFIIEAHGGPTAQFRPSFNRNFQYLMQHGFGLLAPNFRGSTGYGRAFEDADNYRKRLDSVKDVAAGAQWLIDQGYSRRGMIGIKGGSYGGYMTLAAMTEFPDLFAAGLDQVGIANFETFLEKTADYRRSLRESEYGPVSDHEFLRSISPLYKADRIRGALMVVHGENDPRVPVGEARQILAAVRSQGVPVDSLIFPDEGHGIAKRPNQLTFYRKMAEFFERHLAAGRGTGMRNP